MSGWVLSLALGAGALHVLDLRRAVLARAAPFGWLVRLFAVGAVLLAAALGGHVLAAALGWALGFVATFGFVLWRWA
jgi:hypothetical protein